MFPSPRVFSALMVAASALAQPVFIAEGNYNPYDPNKSPLVVYDSAGFTRSNAMSGQSMQAGQSVKAYKAANGKTYVFTIQPFYGNNFFVSEYLGNGATQLLGSTRVGTSVAAAMQMVVNQGGTRAYVLMSDNQLHTLDISVPASPTVLNPAINVPGRKMDLRPQGDRILTIDYNAIVYDVQLSTGTVTALALNLPYFQPQIRFSPNGNVAYFGVEDTAHSFAVLNTSIYPASLLKVEPGPGGNFGMYDVVFHPTLNRAYFLSWPAGGAASQSLYVVDTATHKGIALTPVLAQSSAHYAFAMEPNGARIWLAIYGAGYFLESIPVNSAGVPQPATVHAPIPNITTAMYALAVAQTPPALFATVVSKTGSPSTRVWTLRLYNFGAAPVNAAHISALQITTPANACTPVINTPIPLNFGNLGPYSNATALVTINFSGCPALTKFHLSGTIGSGLGARTGAIANNQSM